MKIYTVIGGVNGVGKSSLSGVLSGESADLGVIIDTDKITAELNTDRINGGRSAVKRIDYCLENGISFTQETTLSGFRTIRTVKKAIELDYYIRLYYIGINTCDESIGRIKNRVSKGGHNIPPDDVRRRFGKRFDDLAKILPYCNEAIFYDNENGFRYAGEYKNGSLIIAEGNTPDWLSEFKQYLLSRREP